MAPEVGRRVADVVALLRDLGPSSPRVVAAAAEARGLPRGRSDFWAKNALRLAWEKGLVERPYFGVYQAIVPVPEPDDRLLAVPHLNGADPEVVQDALDSLTDAFRDLSKLIDQTRGGAREVCEGGANSIQRVITIMSLMLEATQRDSESE